MTYIKVTREDDTIQYFEQSEHGFNPVGGGFVIKVLNHVKSVELVEDLPRAWQSGFCGFDKPEYRCLCNPVDRWNGWAVTRGMMAWQGQTIL